MLEMEAPTPGPLLIPEILNNMLSLLDKTSRLNAALVCRAWYHLVIDHIWSELPGVWPLFRLLKTFPYGDVNTDEPPWDKLFAYARKVRILIQDDLGITYDHTEVAQDVSQFLTMLAWRNEERFLLPRVQELTWLASEENTVSQLVPFLAPGLEKLVIKITDDGVPLFTMRRLFARLINLPVCGLRSFGLTTEFAEDEDATLVEGMAKLLRLQTSLKELLLPAFFTTQTLIRALSGHAHLRTVHCMLNTDEEEAVQQFLLTLVECCPTVLHLHLYFKINDGPKTLNALSPLLGMKSLNELQIFGDHVLPVNAEDIQMMAAAWPTIETLNLCSGASYPDDGNSPERVPLGALLNFAQSFGPNLRQLGLPFNCDSWEDDIHVYTPATPRFPSLRFLGVGQTTITPGNVIPVSRFLSSVCTPGIEFTCVKAHDPQLAPAFDPWAIISETSTVWKEVYRHVIMGHSVQEMISHVVEVNQRTNAELQARVEMLEARLSRYEGVAVSTTQDGTDPKVQ